MGGAAPAVDAPAPCMGRRRQRVGDLGIPTPTTTATRCSSSVADLAPQAVLRPLVVGRPTTPADLDCPWPRPCWAREGGHRRQGRRSPTSWTAPDSGGIGGQEASLGSVCGDDIDGGAPWWARRSTSPACTGIVAVRVTSLIGHDLQVLWSSGTGGGPPVVAAGLVWTIGQDGTLSGLDPATGAVRQRAAVGRAGQPLPDARRRGRAAAGVRCRAGGGLRRPVGTSSSAVPPTADSPPPDPGALARAPAVPAAGGPFRLWPWPASWSVGWLVLGRRWWAWSGGAAGVGATRPA